MTAPHQMPQAVNLHLTRACNYKCTFCYATFPDLRKSIPEREAMEILDELAACGVDKVTFVGGEPTLLEYLPRALRHAKDLDLTTCIVTNASRFNHQYFDAVAPHLDWLGVSIDSLSDGIEAEYGRGDGNHVQHAVWTLHEARQRGIQTKLNTVVGALNWQEDLHELWQATQPNRWKAFRLLLIEGQNDASRSLAISDGQWQDWKARHADLPVIAEDNEDMTSSYVMIDPDGQVFQNTTGTYQQGGRVTEIGFRAALERAGWNPGRFLDRGGLYDWRSDSAQ